MVEWFPSNLRRSRPKSRELSWDAYDRYVRGVSLMQWKRLTRMRGESGLVELGIVEAEAAMV